jgi:hypothetical protein
MRNIFLKKLNNERSGEETKGDNEKINESDEAIKNSTITEISRDRPFFRKGFFNLKKADSGNMRIDTNLIKDQTTVFFDWKKNISFLIYCLITVAIMSAIGYGALFFWESNAQIEVQNMNNEIENIQKLITQAEKNIDDIIKTQQKIIASEKVLKKHIRWTNFFEFLEDYTLADVVYESFSGKTDGDYTLKAKAKNGYYVAAEQIRILKKENKYIVFAETVGGAKSEAENGVEIIFDIKLKVKPDIFISDYARNN